MEIQGSPASPAPPAQEAGEAPQSPEPAGFTLPAWWPIALAVLGGLLLLWLVAKLISARLPQLDGSVEVSRQGQVVGEHVLIGRTFSVSGFSHHY